VSWQPLDVPSVSAVVVAHIPADGSDIVVFQDATRRPYRLAGTAVSIWMAIDGVRTVGDIVDIVGEQHGANTDEIFDDVITMLTQLRGDGILTHRPPTT
jgi:hypothetical protein